MLASPESTWITSSTTMRALTFSLWRKATREKHHAPAAFVMVVCKSAHPGFGCRMEYIRKSVFQLTWFDIADVTFRRFLLLIQLWNRLGNRLASFFRLLSYVPPFFSISGWISWRKLKCSFPDDIVIWSLGPAESTFFSFSSANTCMGHV